MLEKKQFSKIIPGNSRWYRYVDDCLLVTHKTTDIRNLLDKLNNVNDRIQFTVETEKDGRLPFLDTVIIRAGNNVKFQVYRKPTNKDDFVHFYSAHDLKTKSGIIIGFFLRALRICSQEFLDEEINYITKAFKNLCYPVGMISTLLQKATKIKQRTECKDKPDVRYLVVPNSSFSDVLSSTLRPTGLIIVNDTGRKIGHMIKKRKNESNSETSVVYKIPCNDCDSAYYGETYRGLPNRAQSRR